MKLILSSDYQATVSNLDLCQTAIDEVMVSAERYRPDAVIFAGDLKESYEPVSMFAVKFWVATLKMMQAAGLRVIILLGNHDRLSQSARSKNWLDVLRAAGAETVSRPRWKTVGDGRVAFLPFTPSRVKELRWARELADKGNGRGDVLIFHTAVQGARMGTLTAPGITPEELIGDENTLVGTWAGSRMVKQAWAYEAAFGGHFHEFQRLPNYPIWYIGSPFVHRWDEANQIKGHLVVEI